MYTVVVFGLIEFSVEINQIEIVLQTKTNNK